MNSSREAQSKSNVVAIESYPENFDDLFEKMMNIEFSDLSYDAKNGIFPRS